MTSIATGAKREAAAVKTAKAAAAAAAFAASATMCSTNT